MFLKPAVLKLKMKFASVLQSSEIILTKLAKAVGIPVGWRLGGPLAATLLVTISELREWPGWW